MESAGRSCFRHAHSLSARMGSVTRCNFKNSQFGCVQLAAALVQLEPCGLSCTPHRLLFPDNSAGQQQGCSTPSCLAEFLTLQTCALLKSQTCRLASLLKLFSLKHEVSRSGLQDITPVENIRENPKCDRDVTVYGYLRGANMRQGTRVHLAGVGDQSVRPLCRPQATHMLPSAVPALDDSTHCLCLRSGGPLGEATSAGSSSTSKPLRSDGSFCVPSSVVPPN